MKVSEDGEVLIEISVPKLFYDNNLEALLTSNGMVMTAWRDKEIVHLNKIAELSSVIASDFPMLKAGDLALSLRGYNLIFVLDPDTKKIKWWRIGPWQRQHDPEFKPGGKLIIFNNNIHGPCEGRNGSNMMEIDLVSNDHKIIYGEKKGQEMCTEGRGKVELTVSGGLLVTEPEAGRVFETDATGRIVWEYINRYDSDKVAEIGEARIYPADYFNVSDWSCE
jgi:hypothetical protein